MPEATSIDGVPRSDTAFSARMEPENVHARYNEDDHFHAEEEAVVVRERRRIEQHDARNDLNDKQIGGSPAEAKPPALHVVGNRLIGPFAQLLPLDGKSLLQPGCDPTHA